MSGPQGFVYPVVGDSIDVWGLALNTLLGLSETHNHTVGRGNPIVAASLSIDADTPWHTYALTGLKTATFTPTAAASITGYAGALWISSADNELYYRTIAGTNIKFTSGSALNVAAFTGGWGGDYAASGCLASYDSATSRYLFQGPQAPTLRSWNGLAAGPLDLYQPTTSIVNRVRLQSPNALAASYTLTLPAALPASQVLQQVDAAGVTTLSNTIPNNTNITLQGTGSIKRGNRVIRTHARAPLTMNTAGGGATTPSLGSAGAGFPAASTNSIPICPGDDDFGICTINTVDVWIAVSGNTCTFTLQSVSAGGTLSAIPGATSSTASAGQYTKITLTPTTPPTGASIITTGGFLALQIQTLAGATCNVLSVDLNTTV